MSTPKKRKGGRERGEIKNKSKKTQGVLFDVFEHPPPPFFLSNFA